MSNLEALYVVFLARLKIRKWNLRLVAKETFAILMQQCARTLKNIWLFFFLYYQIVGEAGNGAEETY